MTPTTIRLWAKECNRFEKWYKKMGGDISNPNQMQQAFNKIEPKNTSLQNPIHKFFS